MKLEGRELDGLVAVQADHALVRPCVLEHIVDSILEAHAPYFDLVALGLALEIRIEILEVDVLDKLLGRDILDVSVLDLKSDFIQWVDLLHCAERTISSFARLALLLFLQALVMELLFAVDAAE